MSNIFVDAKSRKLKKNRVYFSESDPLAQQNCRISKNELDEKLKILALLHDHITVPVSHTLHSNKTFNLLKRHSLMLKKGIIVPTIDSRYPSFEEYIDASLKGDYYRFNTSHSKESVADFLEDTAKITIYWDFVSQVETFRKSCMMDISDPRSIIRKKLEINDIGKIKTRFQKEKFTTRSFALRIANDLKPKNQTIYMNYINSLYHLNGACHHRAIPNLHHIEIPYIENKFQRSLEIPPNIEFDRDEFFKEVLRSVNIPCTTLRKLNDQDIISLRKAKITRIFREKYNEIIAGILAGRQEEIKGIVSEFQEVKTEFKQALNDEIEKELKRDKTYKKLKISLEGFAYATNLIGIIAKDPTLANAAIGAAAVAGTVYGIVDPLLGWLRNYIGCEFIILAEKYRRQTLSK